MRERVEKVDVLGWNKSECGSLRLRLYNSGLEICALHSYTISNTIVYFLYGEFHLLVFF